MDNSEELANIAVNLNSLSMKLKQYTDKFKV